MRGRSRLALRLCLVLTVIAVGCDNGTPPPEDASADPRTWREAFDATETGWLMNVWGPSSDALLAVGGSFEAGAVMRYDGAEWSPVTVPEGTPLLNWVYGFGPDDAWVVGNEGTILRWDGATLTPVDSPTEQDLWGVWGSGPDDLYAVGGSARLPSITTPTILRYDGADWSVVDYGTLRRANVDAFFKVWGTGPDNVYVVGDKGIVMRWDGATWTELFVGADDDLVSLWGTGPDDIVAVGGRSNGIVARWNGTEWRTEFVTPLPGLNGVWMREPGVAHIAGLRGTLITFDAETFEITEEPTGERFDFHAIYGVDGEMVAVGGNLAFPDDAMGIAYRRELGDGE